jgi:exopolysaccharide biosynthesis polyprenyl glycosylphosphotransferase
MSATKPVNLPDLPDLDDRAPSGYARTLIAISSVAGIASAAGVANYAFESSSAAAALGTATFAAIAYLIAQGGSALLARSLGSGLQLGTLFAVAFALTLGQQLFGLGLEPLQAVGAVAVGALVAGASRRLASQLVAGSPRRVLLVGSGQVAGHVERAFASRRDLRVVGFVDEDSDVGCGGARFLGCLDEIEAIVGEHCVDTVVFAFSQARDSELVTAVERCRAAGVTVAVVPRMFQEFHQRYATRRVGGMPMLVADPRLHEAHRPAVSRLIDIAVSCTFALFALPVFLLIALLIKLESPGPIFYRARRVGVGGREFAMLKFRKMRNDAQGPKITLADDQRFTRVGRFLAASKLDELPQLWNVIRGEMTLVGPRPEDPSYVAEYPDQFREILSVRPGITGLSQIQYRDESSLLVGDDFEQLYRDDLLPRKIAFDRHYAARRNLALDLKIIAWTAVAIVAGAQVHRCPMTRQISFRRGGEQHEAPLA